MNRNKYESSQNQMRRNQPQRTYPSTKESRPRNGAPRSSGKGLRFVNILLIFVLLFAGVIWASGTVGKDTDFGHSIQALLQKQAPTDEVAQTSQASSQLNQLPAPPQQNNIQQTDSSSTASNTKTDTNAALNTSSTPIPVSVDDSAQIR